MKLKIYITNPRTQIGELIQIMKTKYRLTPDSQLQFSGMINQTKTFNESTLKLMLEVKCRKAHKITCHLNEDHVQFSFDNQILNITKLND